MRRREIIVGLGGAVAWNCGAAGQPAMAVLGILYSGGEPGLRQRMVAFRQGLAELNFEEGRNILCEYRWASDDHRRLPELAADLVGRGVAVLVCFGPAAGVAARAASQDIPIVFVALADPVRLGLVESLGHPGRNATGTASLITELDAKRFELLHELVPGDRPVGVLVNPNRPSAES